MISSTSHISDFIFLINLSGRIDSNSVRELESEIFSLINSVQKNIVINLQDIFYVSSAGLRLFLTIKKNQTKIEKDVFIISNNKQILDIFKLSGFSKMFSFYPDLDELLQDVKFAKKEEVLTKIVNNFRFDYLNKLNVFGKVKFLGNYKKDTFSNFSQSDVEQVKFADFLYAAGIAGLGNSFDEFKDYLGESVLIDGNFFNFPAIERASVDFVFKNESHKDSFINYLKGFAFNGHYSKIISFNQTIELKSLINSTIEFADTNLFGVILLAESNGTLSINLRKNLFSSEKNINFHNKEKFFEYFNFNIEPAFYNHLVLGIGLVAKNKTASINSVFPEESNFHLHSAIFEKDLLNLNLSNFQKEISRIITDNKAIHVNHLLSGTEFQKGLIGIINLEE